MQDKHKPKNSVVSNLSIPLCILTLLWLGCSLVNPVGYGEEVFAEEGSTANTIVNNHNYTESTVGISIKPTGNVALTPISEAGVATKYNTTATITVQNSGGYTVFVGSNNENLKGQSTGTEIASITSYQAFDNIENNHWGFAYQEGSTVASDTSYAPIPVGSTGKEVLKNQNSEIENETREVTLSYAARINTEVPADLYQNQVTLSVISTPMKVATFQGITTMQALTPQVCALADENDTAYLEDIRDRVGGSNGEAGTGTYYWVTKLADGNCWMSQNLDLNLDVDKPLTVAGGSASDYTPVVSTFGPSYPDKYAKTYWDSSKAYRSWDEGMYVVIQPGVGQEALLYIGFIQAQGGIAGFTNSQTILEQAKTQDDISAESIVSLGNSGLLTQNGVVVDVSGNGWRVSTDPNFTMASQYELTENGRTITLNKNPNWAVDFSNKVYDAHYLVGNYYQWLAANALTESDGQYYDGSTTEKSQVPVGQSICPAGWQLPLSGNTATINNNGTSGSFYNLLQDYVPFGAVANDVTGYDISLAPLVFNRSGVVATWLQQIRGIGASGRYWSSAAYPTANAFYLGFNVSSANPTDSANRANGFSVRCLVLSPQE